MRLVDHKRGRKYKTTDKNGNNDSINPLTPGALGQKRIFSLDLDFCSGMRRSGNQNFDEKFKYVFKFFGFFFFVFPFSPFFIFFAAVIDLLLGLLPVQKFLRKVHRDGILLTWSSSVVKCSRRKFWCELFTQISEHFRAYLRLH